MMRTLHPIILAPMAALSLAGCTTVGPNYAGPPQRPAQAAFVRAEAGAQTAAPRADWWRALGDPILDGLVEAAISANGDVHVAISRLDEERALLRGQKAAELPSGGAVASYARTRPYLAQFGVSPASNTEFDLYRAELDASWELDLFGRQRRGTEAARANVAASAADLDNVRLSVAADVAQAYLDLRGLQSRIDHIHRLAEGDRRLIDLITQRRSEGTASELDLGRVRAQRLVTLADEPAIRGAITIQIDRLAVLTGRDPGALDAELSPAGTIPAPPVAMAIGDPASLIRQRPDVRAAERRLAAATAQIGVATAELFPRVSLIGSLGRAAQEPGDLVKSDASIFSIGPSLSWSFLDIGRVRARIARADAHRDGELTLYETAVRGALQDAEAGLTRFARQRETVAARLHALRAATGAAALVDQRYHEGTASMVDTIEARRQETMADDGVRIAETDLAKAYVALSKSLGLAWAPVEGAKAP